MERGTATILQYSVQLVPGLLQTEAYAREVLSAIPPGLDIERRVEFRMRRQKLLTDEQAPRLWVVLDEAVLRRPVGGEEVMDEQLQRLIDAAALPNVTLQVLPFTADVTRRHNSIFNELRAAALSPAESIRTLANVQQELR
jgi:Domain of unknown function (DUF5753)